MLKIQKNIALKSFTTFQLGGLAKYFVEAKSEKDILEAVSFAQKNNWEIFILGGGSNILVSDEGFDGLVIKLQNGDCRKKGNNIECEAGAFLSQALKVALENSLTGLEWAAGIPGTVGGAIRGNAGAFGLEMSQSVENVKFMDLEDGMKIKTLKNKECGFDYRKSIFKESKKKIILSAVLNLEKGEKSKIESEMKEIITKRIQKQPQGVGSAGSIFKNPQVENQALIERFQQNTGLKSLGGKIPAGWLIAEAGLQGKKIGQIQVSEKHANFVINLGGAKAQEAVMMISLIKQKVRDELGVELQEEIEYLGF